MKDYDAIAHKGEYKSRCNFTACTSGKPATWYHFSTLRYYCEDCAAELNRVNKKEAFDLLGHDLLVPILRKHDEAEAVGEPGEGYWWCPECREAVDGHEVTFLFSFQEYHERCGTKVIAKATRPAPTDEKALRGEWLNAKTNPPRDAKKQVCINRNGGAFFARYAGGDWLDDDALLRDPVLYISIPLLAREAPKDQA